jgi:membrane protein YdbS with pleckstrin-like domain
VFAIRVKTGSRRWDSVQSVLSFLLVTTPIVLKLTGVIAWSWWWVLAPTWISGVLAALALAGMVVLLRRDARKKMRMLIDVPPDEWTEWLARREADPDT